MGVSSGDYYSIGEGVWLRGGLAPGVWWERTEGVGAGLGRR